MPSDLSVAFLGSMNAMPMMYAIELKKRGVDVRYLVDRKKSDTLSRPECHFPSINYPYEDWIKELFVPSQLLVSAMPMAFYALLSINFLKRHTHVFLSGGYIALAPYFKKRKIFVQHLTYGADLDWFCNIDKIDELTEEFCGKSFTKYLPRKLVNWIIRKVIANNIKGAKCAQNLISFPLGFSSAGDRVIRRLANNGVNYIPRFDVSEEVIGNRHYYFKIPKDEFVILSPVRFHFFNRLGENKGNDVIIKGISLFIRSTSLKIKVIFFNKGPDVDLAKQLCLDEGISQYIRWVDPVPMEKLLDFYEEADVCFDQVGDHWVSGVGIYSLMMGKPTIANPEKLSILFSQTPILAAKTPEQVFKNLSILSSESVRRDISLSSYEFGRLNFGPGKVINQIFK